MTALGKILVFLNLAFSLVVAGLIVVVYSARINWHEAYKDAVKEIGVARASAQAYQQELAIAQQNADKVKNELQQQVAAKDKELSDLKGELQKAVASMKNAGEERDGENKSAKALDAQLKRREAEVKTLEETVKQKDTTIDKITKEKQTLRDEKVNAEIVAASLKDRLERMTVQMEEMTRELVALRRSGATIDTTLVARENPPPQNVEGLVKQTDQSGFLTISIGSDAGLQKGHTLDVYRYTPSPQYLGQIRLFDVRPNEAVGKPVKQMKSPVQAGDRVGNLAGKS